MVAITYFLIGNPLVALGLAILILLCIYNVLRRQVRTAMGLWLLIIVVFVYVYAHSAEQTRRDTGGAGVPDSTIATPGRN